MLKNTQPQHQTQAKPQLVDCKFCGKSFRNKNSLGCHMWRFHKEKSQKQMEQQQPGNPAISLSSVPPPPLPPGNPASVSVPPGMLSMVPPGPSDPKEEAAAPMMVPTSEADL